MILSTILALSALAQAQPGLESEARQAGAWSDSQVQLAAGDLRGGMTKLKESIAAGTAARKAAPPEPKQGIIPHFQQKLFPAPAGGACGLKSFTVLDYEVRSNDGDLERSRITVEGAVIETTAPDCARDYGVVQFIRGCAYHARYALPAGVLIERTFDVARRLRGPRVVFNHPAFEVDQTELDPLYVSYPKEEEDRLGLDYVPNSPLRLRPDRASMLADLKALDDPGARTFLKDLDGPASVTYVADVPEGGVTMVNEEKTLLTAANSSLDFQTCVYRLKDVPTTGDPAGLGTPAESGGPIQCFAWASRYTFDMSAKDFVTDLFQGVDPFCSQAPPRQVLPGS
ncbi:MAG: hypothetical protein NTY77_08690 [Elusimicrobia bacterium]|nr:hypothetical protein [Elusimicrobiota bacterium]